MRFTRPRRLVTAAAASALATTTLVGLAAPSASAAPAPISQYGFSLHFLEPGTHAYPSLPFGSARTQDMGVTWADLQPTQTTVLTTDGSNPGVNRLTQIVNLFHSHGVRPLIVLGWTPSWAADPSCNPGTFPQQTCPPVILNGQSPDWTNYVRFLAKTYKGVDFEVWNEPNLHSAFADNNPATGARKIAVLQSLAYTAVHNAANGDRLVSPGVAVTPGNQFAWLKAFFSAPGGKKFDYFGIHLYPVDKAVKGGYGPEWSVGVLAQIRTLLKNYGVGGKQIWDTEMNIGRQPQASPTSRTFDESGLGAAMVARTYLSQLSSGVARVYWYAADDRDWGGTWMEKSDFKTLTAAGKAEKVLRGLIVNARPYGCLSSNGRWSCKFVLANGKHMRAVWTTRSAYYMKAPAHSARLYFATGGYKGIHGGSSIKVTSTPQYIWGTFTL